MLRHLVDVGRWMSEGMAAYVCVFVIAIVGFFGTFVWHSEESIRLAGYVLQFLGMILAIFGLLKIRTHFEQPSLRQSFLNWLKRFPSWKRKTHIGSQKTSWAIKGHKARVELWNTYDPAQALEKRIEGIAINLDQLRKNQNEHAEAFEKLSGDHEKYKKISAKENEKLENKIQSNLKSLHTDDLIPSLVGLIWLTVGISMSTMAPELSTWVCI